MEKLINLPEDIKPGTEILVRDLDYEDWVKRVFVCTYNDKVYVEGSYYKDTLMPHSQAKLPETKLPKTDWTKVPIGTKVLCWDENDGYKKTNYFMTLVNGTPFTSFEDLEEMERMKKDKIGLQLYSWDYVELAEEEF